ncbi:hypothetical protein [Paenibacillus xylaniclasticus]|uniref:hypothetical protein n=1 Tax=Paenibacillus xylaniclasticus TaxID=588083 RepID=UPI000FDAA267|nr:MULTISPECIES: hypothetical protein [Paenibacillus]GFN30892.1 hypothetical protein PCURB6_11520 [Paenibacillus curdlanolyticus]
MEDKVKQIIPYNDIWLDCVSNNLLAMLIQMDESYRNAPLMMGIKYCKTVTDQEYSSEEARLRMLSEGYLFPYINYSSSFIEGFVMHSPFSFTTYEGLLDFIKSNLEAGSKIFLVIDRLFYPTGRESGKTSMVHPVFIFNFNDESQCFHAIEDCITPGYMDYYDIPYTSIQKSCQSFLEQGKPITGNICRPLETPLSDGLSLAKAQALNMVNHILEDTICHDSKYDLTYYMGLNGLTKFHEEMELLFRHLEDDFIFKSFIMRFPQLHARNKKLIQLLYNGEYLDQAEADKLTHQYQALQSQWELYKKRSYFMLENKNASYNTDKNIIRKLSDRMKNIIELEQNTAEMFRSFLIKA